MKGDFSKWKKVDGNENFSGVLHQQGRVLLDEDWNAQARITNHWQDTAARDTIGPGVAAVPADDHDAFRVSDDVTVDQNGDKVIKVKLSPGRVWADGLLVHLSVETELIASYLETPNQTTSITPAEPGTRDAVILEVWREAVNGFQEPESLIETALGGPDTTERVHTAMALRLLRLGAGQACENIRNRLLDNQQDKPRLRASLRPTHVSNGDCPKVSAGGYTGFEHYLYRIEIAETNRAEPMFKWSQFNGGLVGRGEFHTVGTDTRFRITANDQAINSSGLDSFYLEALKFDEEYGHWRVVYGATVTLDGDDLRINDIYFTDEYFTAEPPTESNGDGQNGYFFRLWNGIEEVSKYVVSITGPVHLHNGIGIEINPPPSQAAYRPGDYWTFSVRAGLNNKTTLLDWQRPEGIDYHRVPLAELHWGEDYAVTIEDCRRIFRPLTRQKVCCSYTVGDGISSHGDVDSIQEAIDKLPPWGGEIHLLPGIHRACVEINNKFNVTIRGCNLRTLILPEDQDRSKPMFRIINSYYIKMEHLWLFNAGRTAVLVDGGQWFELAHNIIFSLKHALRVNSGRVFHIHDNTIRMLDRENGDVAIYFAGDDGFIERNSIAIVVIPQGQRVSDPDTEVTLFDVNDRCVSAEEIENNPETLSTIKKIVKSPSDELVTDDPYRALGGIQIAGGCDRVVIRDNWIHGGDGNGITLGTGHVVPSPAEPEVSEPTSTTKKINIVRPYLRGTVTLNGVGLEENITLRIWKIESGRSVLGQRIWIITTQEKEGESAGCFSFQEELPLGWYVMSIDTIGYAIEEIITIEVGRTGVLANAQEVEVKVIKEEEDQNAELGFLYDIAIENNRITRMGLCGIGAPAGLPNDQGGEARAGSNTEINQTYSLLLGNPVVRLHIEGNRIRNCLQNPSRALGTIGHSRGLGGISLGMCESLTIRGNRIEDNGRDHRDPVCGIFAAYSALADISDNYIANNGPLNAGADLNIQPGIRGGVVLPASVSITLEGALQTTRLAAPPAEGDEIPPLLANAVRLAGAMGGYAVRIHDNLIEQPLNHALNICAFGPVSVANNQLISDFPESSESMKLAGTVFIKNIGQPHYLRRHLGQPVPSGSIVFSDNHIRLGLANTLTSITILSADDIAFVSNHSDVMEEARPILVNALLGALTLRASHNRLQEVIDKPARFDVFKVLVSSKSSKPQNGTKEMKTSLFSYGVFMNDTTDNQGNHCVIPLCSLNNKLENVGNQALVVPKQLCENAAELLGVLTRYLLRLFYQSLVLKS